MGRKAKGVRSDRSVLVDVLVPFLLGNELRPHCEASLRPLMAPSAFFQGKTVRPFLLIVRIDRTRINSKNN